MSESVVDQATNRDLSSESEKRSKPFKALRAVNKVKFKEMENQGYVEKGANTETSYNTPQ